jgi:hypothetical protein
MAVSVGEVSPRPPEPVPERPAHAAPTRARPRWHGDVAAAAVFLIAAFVVTGRLWLDPARRTPAANPQDHVFFQWVLAHGANVVFDGAYPFTSDAMNMPDGVNLMANTSILGLSVPVAPLTMLWGPQVTFALLLVLGLAGTAFGWYWLFSRHLVESRPVAFVTGALCGFAPGMISHAQGHVNWTAQFVVPPLILAVLRLRRPGRALRGGVVLGLLVAYQAFVNEEVLFYTALALGLFVIVYALLKRATARELRPQFLRGLLVALVVAGALLAYPLWVQFFGPQHYHGVPSDVKDVSTDLAAYPAFARLSIAGDLATAQRLAQGPAEENSFLGWPLLLMCGAAVALTWRRAVTWALLAVGVVFAALSLGPEIVFNGNRTGVPGPWRWLAELPVFDAVVPTRLTLVVVPAAAGLLALGADRALSLARGREESTATMLKIATAGALAVALVPLVPRWIPAVDTPRLPTFVTDGGYREYAPPGTSIVFAPLPTNIHLTGMRWAARSELGFAIAGGYFLGPGAEDGRAIFNAPARPTAGLLNRVWRTGFVPRFSVAQRRAFADDMGFWKAAAIVVPATERNAGALRRAVDALSGRTGRFVGGVWLWDLR